MVGMSILTKPVCTICNAHIQNMETLRIHMKNVHNESEHEKLDRVQHTVESAFRKDTIANATKTSLDCTECGLLFATDDAHRSHMEKNHGREVEIEYETIKAEHYVIKEYPENNETEEDQLLNKIFGVEKQEKQKEGVTMKGKNIAFKDACTLVKSKLTKGMIIQDSKGRQMKILNKKTDGALEVE